MIRFTPSVRRCRLSLAIGTSTLAWGLFLPTASHAQCAPDPTVTNGTTVCTGTDADGVRVTTDASTVQVGAAAAVTGLNAPAIAVDVPGQADVFTPRTGTITVAGTVDGGSQSGINVLSGSVPSGSFDFYGTQVSVAVAAGANVTGTSAITAGSSSGNNYGAALVSLDNAGTISGDGGVALLATDLTHGGFSAINNAASGSIGAISGAVGQLTNAGLIDGGTRSAIDQTTTYNSAVYPYADWTNSGTIRSSSADATIANLGQSQTLINSGTIANTGAGAAVQGANLTITNLAGGQIMSAGTTAIATTSGVTLTNAGTINGDVVADPSQGTGFFSTIDSTAGTIAGNVSLGGGNDLVYARYAGTPTLVTGITGTLDVGGGTNSIVLAPATDLTISTALALPTGFQRLRLDPAEGATLTLADGFVAPGTMELAGAGTILNQAAIITAGQAFIVPYYVTNSSPTLINAGSIRAAPGQGLYALGLGDYASLTNSGTISSAGNGLMQDFGTLSNTGSIVATGTAVSQFDATFDNQGLIRSTGGIGVSLSGNQDNTPATNSGRIEGATYGVVTAYVLTNSGTIAATGSGTAVGLSSYGVLNNLAGGVISGGAYAITGADPYGSTSVYNGQVFNAGMINGDVTFVAPQSYGNNGNLYVALPGGVLNGNLALGKGDTLVTDLVNTGSGSFAGITGTVASDGGLLRYRVSGTASAVIGPVGPFATTGYELVDGAQLTLTAPTTQSLPIVLAGNGTVDLTADANVTNRAALSVVTAATLPGASQTSTSGLTITSRGTLAGTINDYFSAAYGVVVLGSAASLDNEGIIKATYAATNGGDGYNPAVLGGASLTNNGRIELDGSYGAYNVATVTNTGTIVQTGPGTSYGITGASSVTNSGTIQTAGAAIQGSYAYGTVITNSGTIASTGNSAIDGSVDNGTVTNLAGGTISGGAGTAISMSGGSVVNAGTITGNINLTGYYGYQSAYYSNGGTLVGNLTLTSGDDLFLQGGDSTGVSGTIDAGAGRDVYGRALTASGTVAIGPAPGTGFEDAMVAAFGSGTVATLTGVNASFGIFYAVGDGTVVNQATLTGAMMTTAPTYAMQAVVGSGPLNGLTNAGSISGGVSGSVTQFVNTGTIGSGSLAARAVALVNQGALSFTNSGQITASATDGYGSYLVATDTLSLSNTGAIDNGLIALADFATQGVRGALTASNAGAIRASSGPGLDLSASAEAGSAGGSVLMDNSGTLSATSMANAAGLTLSLDGTGAAIDYVLRNSGSITASISATDGSATVVGLGLIGTGSVSGTISNGSTGMIRATGTDAVALQVGGTALDLDNAGTIAASGTGALAIKAIDGFDNKIVNTGTVTGSILLGDGNDTVENRGTITGKVFLGAGDDSFLEQASATLTGTVDGGDGLDTLIVDATGGGTVNGDQFVDFERFNQVGTGNVTYAGDFRFDTIGVSGGTVTVAAGQTLVSNGATTITGSDAAETLVNNGTIAGAVSLGAGNDTVVNNGAIAGSVSLGNGDDQFVEGVGSSVAGTVDGGAGNDLYTVVLAGNRTGIGQRTGFEQLALQGGGTLSLVLDQNFKSVALGGNNLTLSLAGHNVGAVTASDAAETLTVNGDIASVSLGGGDDTLALGTTQAAGSYNGGTGNNALRFTAAGPVTLSGTATNFATVSLAGNALTVAGTLGSAGTAISFGAGDQSLTIAKGGTLTGTVDLGDGNDSFRLAAGATLNGTVNGGAGSDTATIELAGNNTLTSGLIGFETLTTEGTGQLSITGTQAFNTVSANTDLAIAAGGSLTATQVRFDAGDNRFIIAGAFTGSVDGGAGNDTLAVSGGSEAAPIIFGSISNVESYSQSAGFARVSGTAAFSALELTGGRLVGQAGSVVTAPQILVNQGATFGSAGTVNGNITVAGTLSPGASPGTMTVNGNVTLASGSTSLFELSSTVSDKLVVNGGVAIGTGSTLQLVEVGTLRPGTSYTLITATGGITGGYTTVIKPADLFGFIVQRANEIDLLGEFLDTGGFGPQVSRSIAYTNRTLEAQASSSTLFDALPALLTSAGASNPQAFARLTPEPYASATQMGTDDALVLIDAARGPSFAATGEGPHAYTFASTLGQWHEFSDDQGAGTSAAHTQGYGFLGGLGYGDATWSVGAFGGYLNDRQTIGALAARTKADGAVAGVQGRMRTASGFGLNASVIYDGSQATTTRVLPVGSASGRYSLHSWVSDVKASYEVGLPGDWAVTPQLGVTYLRTTRGGLSETGGSPFALTVARDRHVAGFADGAVAFGRGEASAAPFRPFVTLGVRYQIEGTRTDALAGYAGGGLGLEALGAPRARVVGTASGGIAYRLQSGLNIFATAASQTGNDDHQESISAGVRFRF